MSSQTSRKRPFPFDEPAPKRMRNGLKSVNDMDAKDHAFMQAKIEGLRGPANGNGCCLYTGGSRGQYPCIDFCGKKPTIQRVIMLLEARQEIPPHLKVTSVCNNPRCMTVDHLRIQTQAGIAVVFRARARAEGKQWSNSALDDDTVKEIVELLDKKTNKEIAEQYGVDPRRISDIRTGTKRNLASGVPKPETKAKPVAQTTLTQQYASDTLRRIREKCDIETPEDPNCHWLYTRLKDNEYPETIYYLGHGAMAHVAALLAHQGLERAPDGKPQVRHKCGHRNCCNPKHLEFGTAKENAQDKKRDGTHRSGEDTLNATITNDEARVIKYRLSLGETPFQIAKRTGVSEPTIRNIRDGKSFRFIKPNDSDAEIDAEEVTPRAMKKAKTTAAPPKAVQKVEVVDEETKATDTDTTAEMEEEDPDAIYPEPTEELEEREEEVPAETTDKRHAKLLAENRRLRRLLLSIIE